MTSAEAERQTSPASTRAEAGEQEAPATVGAGDGPVGEGAMIPERGDGVLARGGRDAGTAPDPYATKPVFYQVSTLNALMMGNMDGVVTAGELKRHGAWGIGTYEGLDGEAIVCDGQAYNAHADGTACEYPDDARLAFATVANFTNRAAQFGICGAASIDEAKDALDTARRTFDDNDNAWALVAVRGSYPHLRVRSCEKWPSKPYPPFAELASNQHEHAYEHETGWVVGVWVPEYLQGINMPGWHLHFLSDDRRRGGHLLELSVARAEGRLETYARFAMDLPTNREFDKLDLAEDLARETRSVEG